MTVTKLVQQNKPSLPLRGKQSFSISKGLVKAFQRYTKRYLDVGKKLDVKNFYQRISTPLAFRRGKVTKRQAKELFNERFTI